MRVWFQRILAVAVCLAWGSVTPGHDPIARADWLAQAHQQVAAREYRASENGQGLQAPNRAHNLRT
jgi:hypothetical protein